MTTTISQDVLTVLSACRVDGPAVFLPPGQLDRKLYLSVNKVLEALGGKWNRKAKGHLFPSDPATALDDAIVTGGYAHPRDEFGFFPTPAAVANLVAELAELRDGQRVLEPSAGTGALVSACLARVPNLGFSCIELQPTLAAGLRVKYPTFDVLTADFLAAFHITTEDCPLYDRVVMNPPFARQQDVDHVEHAFRLFLKPGGRLVSVMSAGATFRQDRKAREFREALRPTFHPLPEGSFLESGTDVCAVIAVVDKE